MYIRILFAASLLTAFLLPAEAQNQTMAQRLGYPVDAKLLIIHADDLAVTHSEDMASFEALNRGAVSSASVMVPCPWLTEVANYAKAHPEADLGLHLTLGSEWITYKWGPISPRDQVPSLLDPHGYFYQFSEDAVQHMKPEEAEREIRAQLEFALKIGIHPTHLDSHMMMLYMRRDLAAVLVKIGHEYHLPFLMWKLPGVPPDTYAGLTTPDDVTPERVFMAEPPIEPDAWLSYYTHFLQTVSPGVTELIVHLDYDDAEMRAVTVDHPDWGSAWRQRDFYMVTSPDFRKALKENHIVVVNWRDLGRLLPAH
jgi:hypothetical protein